MGREVERLKGGMKNRICICLAGTYWFLYGGVLFAGIDTLAIEGVEIDSAVRETSRTRQRKAATLIRARFYVSRFVLARVL